MARFSACDICAHFLLRLTWTINHADLHLEIHLGFVGFPPHPSGTASSRPSIPFEPIPFPFFFPNGDSATGTGCEEHPSEGEEGDGEEDGESGMSRGIANRSFPSLRFPFLFPRGYWWFP